jgi:hypothetical protein
LAARPPHAGPRSDRRPVISRFLGQLGSAIMPWRPRLPVIRFAARCVKAVSPFVLCPDAARAPAALVFCRRRWGLVTMPLRMRS